MSQIHPELNRILEEYNKISSSYEDNSISLPDAISSIAQLQVIDGQGWLWGIDHNTGNFVRSSPGSPDLIPSDPDDFAPSQIPFIPSPSARPTAPYETPAPSWDSAPGTSSDPHDAWTPPPPPSRRGTAKKSSSKRLPRERPLRTKSDGAVPSFISQNRRTIIIGVVVVIILGLVVAGRHKTSPSTSTLPPATTVPRTTPTTQPTTTPTTTPVTSVPLLAPSAREMSGAFTGIDRGTPSINAVLSYVDRPGNRVAVVQHVAFFSGLAKVHAILTQSTAQHTGSGTAQSTFLYRDAVTHEVLYTGRVYWVRHTSAWRMSTWPTFS